MIKMIWAVSGNGYIGKDGKLPWHSRAELQHFKELTTDDIVVMGRKTWESLPIKPLPERVNVVVSRKMSPGTPGIIVAHSVKAVMEMKQHDMWIIGGGETYTAFMPYADELHVSEMHFDVQGDVVEPIIDNNWKLKSATPKSGFTYEIYERVK